MNFRIFKFSSRNGTSCLAPLLPKAVQISLDLIGRNRVPCVSLCSHLIKLCLDSESDAIRGKGLGSVGSAVLISIYRR